MDRTVLTVIACGAVYQVLRFATYILIADAKIAAVAQTATVSSAAAARTGRADVRDGAE